MSLAASSSVSPKWVAPSATPWTGACAFNSASKSAAEIKLGNSISSISSRSERMARPPDAIVWVTKIFFLLLAIAGSSPLVLFIRAIARDPFSRGNSLRSTAADPAVAVDSRACETDNLLDSQPHHPSKKIGRGDPTMFNPQPAARLSGLGLAIMMILATGDAAQAQGLVKGVQQGAEAGNKAAGPVGGVLGGAIGGVVGVFNGALGVHGDQGQAQGQGQQAQGQGQTAAGTTKPGPATAAKTAKGSSMAAASSGKPVEVLTQPGEPELTAEQIVVNSDAYIDRIKTELHLTPEQEKSWSAFNSAMHYLGHNGAERLNLRIARAKRDPPDDIVEQMRNEAQFLVDRAADQRAVADAAEPLFISLNDKQKQTFIEEMVRLSHERGLD